MAWYLDLSNLKKTAKPENEWWTHVYTPGAEVPVSGIYKCTGCKREVTSNKGDPFPSQNHHQHPAGAGDIRWELIVRTNTAGD
jgi:hypothetical protein